MDINISD